MSTPTSTPPRWRWLDLPLPVRILVVLLITLAALLVYHQAEFVLVRLFGVVLLFVFAAILALILNPVVVRIQEHVGLFKSRRALAVLALYAALLVLLIAAGALVIPSLVVQAEGFGKQMPELLNRGQAELDVVDAQLGNLGLGIQLSLPRGAGTVGGNALNSAVTVLTQTVTTLVNLLLITVISIYLLVQGKELIGAARRLFPHREEVFDFTVAAFGTTVGAYVRGQLIMATIIGLYTGGVMSLLGVRYAVVLGVSAFFLEFLPLIGAPVAMVLAVLVALFQSPVLALEAAVAGVGGHALEAYIIGPRVTGKAVRVHPLVAMAALLVGADLGGILGALFAVPIAGVVNVFLGALYRGQRGDDAFSTAAGGEVGVDDLPRLSDEISETPPEAAEPTAEEAKPPPARPRRSRSKAAAAK